MEANLGQYLATVTSGQAKRKNAGGKLHESSLGTDNACASCKRTIHMLTFLSTCIRVRILI